MSAYGVNERTKGKGMSSKQRLVYGIVNENLVLLPEDVAKAFAADHKAFA